MSLLSSTKTGPFTDDNLWKKYKRKDITDLSDEELDFCVKYIFEHKLEKEFSDFITVHQTRIFNASWNDIIKGTISSEIVPVKPIEETPKAGLSYMEFPYTNPNPVMFQGDMYHKEKSIWSRMFNRYGNIK